MFAYTAAPRSLKFFVSEIVGFERFGENPQILVAEGKHKLWSAEYYNGARFLLMTESQRFFYKYSLTLWNLTL